jgi:probable rRNA maturation factor
MAVSVVNTTRRRINAAVVRRSIELTLSDQKRKGDVSVVFIGNARMRTLNRTYRGKDKATDVLSFTEAESELAEEGFLGELFIAPDVVEKQARSFAPSFTWELAFMAIHGTLHLLGYEDETEAGADEMERIGQKIIKKVYKR